MKKILIFGDIFGKAGRRAIKNSIDKIKEEYRPDIISANVENLAHGKGVTESTLNELASIGIDVFTSGNHVFDKLPEAVKGFEKYPSLIRPLNYAESMPGRGWVRLERGGANFLFVNLGGMVFFENQYKGEIKNPFFEMDKFLEENAGSDDIIIVDFHAEATSEKVALGHYLDGRVQCLYGTHTHVPTSDLRILPKGTGYVTDVGMTGPINSVIGVKVEKALHTFLEKGKFQMEPEEEGECVVNAVLLEIEKKECVKIQRIQINIK